MKKLMKEILVILVLMALMINSSLLMIVSTALDAISEALDESKINSVLEMSLEKYVNYSLDEQTKGTLVQMNVKTGIEYAEGQEYKPLEYTETLLQAPKIEGEYPERVEFIAKSTKATNGDDNAKDIGYEYDRNNGIVRVGVQNKEDEQGNVYSENVNGARDEFVVLYYYGANCYNDQNVKRELEFKGKIYETIHNDDKSKIEKDYSNSQEVTENIGGLVSTNVSTSDLYNGYIYSNINNGTDLDTEYTENTQLSISYKEISDEIVINQNTKFIDAKDDEVDTQDVVYKGAKINKDKIVNVLGEDFKIYVLNDAGETIAEINKDTETDDSGIIDLNYDKEYTNVNFKVSKPVKAGYLQIENKKAIKNTMKTIENNKIKLTQEIICQNNIQEKNEQTGEVKNEYTKQVNSYKTESIAEIKNSESKIELHSDKQKLTNSTKNDVIFTAVLKTNEAKYNLFKNPVIEIEMPSEVDNVILGDVSLLYDSNLSIKNYEVQDKNGIKVIRIQLDGTQTDYNNSVISEGANIIIPATIIVNKDIYSTQSSIKMKYSNETGIATSYAKQGKDCEELQINIDSMNVPVATYSAEGDDSNTMDVADSVTNVSLNGLKIESYAKVGDMTLKDGDTVYEKEVINYFVKLTNTTENEMTNFNVKALVPDGTTYITKDGSWAYQSTADTESIRNDLQIKYEDKKDVSTDLEKIEAGGTYALTYAVVVNDINDGEQKNLENKIFINDAETDSKVNLVAKKGKMKVDLYPADKEYGKYKNMYVFEARVYNTSNEKITNVKLESTLATEMELNYVTGGKDEYDATTKKLKIDVGDIDANSSKLVSIRLNAINFKDGISEYTIPFDLEVYGDNTNTYRGDTQHVKAYSADIVVKTESPTEGQEVEIGDEVEYNVTIKNTGTVNEYITGIDNLPDGIIPIKAKYNKFGYDSEGKEIIQKEEEISLTSKVEIEGEQSYDFKLESIIPKDETINITIIGEADAVDQKTEVSNNVTVYAKETGTKVSNGIVHTILPYEFEEEGEGEKPDISDEELYGKPPEGETDSTGDDEQTKDDNNNSNNGNGSNNGNNSNGGNNSSDSGDSSDTNTTNNKFYSISGKAWIDNNQDGRRNSDEELLKDVTVKLFNSDTNSIVTDKDGNSKITTTNDSGEYKFENIAKGNYLVIFGYDTNIYTTTKYQSSGATASTNSDAIAKEVSIDGQNKIVGVTDILNIKSDNIENIDIGLIKSQKFDLKLDKYVSKITVENSDGTKEYSYKNSKLAKVEIASKKLAGSTVKIEYKIVVTNEGELSGEVNEIIDYLPSGMTFDSELNKGWYKGYDGNLRNSSLAENKINPGETKELTLILSRTLTENSTGMIENIAEISSATNVNYVSDIDSTPGNKKEGEDDYSKAQVIVSIKTGIVQSITMIFIMLAVLIAVVFIMKNRRIRKSIKFFTMFIVFIFIGGYAFIAQAGTYFADTVNIRYKLPSGWGKGEDNGALWIEETNGIWHYGPSFNQTDKMENDGNSLSPGFICITPGYHLCSFEDHIYSLTGEESSYLDYDRFAADMGMDYYKKFAWRDLCLEEGANYFTSSGNEGSEITLTKGNNGRDVNIESINKDGNEALRIGPFKYTTSGVTSSSAYNIYVENMEYILCDEEKKEIGGVSDLSDGEDFYIIPMSKDKKSYVIDGKIRVVMYITGKSTITQTGIKVGVYNTEDNCRLGLPQTFIRLRAFTDETEKASTPMIVWNVNLNKGSLSIKKVDSQDGKPVPSIKFKITRIKSDITGELDTKYKYIRWTDENGKIKLNNIPIGSYKVEEIGSSNYEYPKNIQLEEDIKIKSIEYKPNDEKDEEVITNIKSYFVQVKKVDSNNKGVPNVRFLVAKQNADESIENSMTNEFGIFESSLELPTNYSSMKADEIFKIKELKNEDENLYLYPNSENDDYRPIIWIKYKAKTKRWYVVGNDKETELGEIRTLDELHAEDINKNYDYIYINGIKIGFSREENKIMLYFINDYIASIGIRKIDSDTNERINGAKFKIYFKGTDGKNYYISSYSYDVSTRSAKVKWTTNEENAKEFITGEKYADVQYDGVIKLKGIPKNTYYAKEVYAPEGYNYSSEKEYKIGKYEKVKLDSEGKTFEYNAWFGDKTYIKGKEQYVITNELSRKIGIQKVDSDNTKIKLNGVKFIIWRVKNGNIEYITKYRYNKETQEKYIEWDAKESNAIQFETGYNYLDGNKYYTKNGNTYYEKNNKEYELSKKNYDGNKGEIILYGMETKTYYAKEIQTIQHYKIPDKNKYQTNGKCTGIEINWLVSDDNDNQKYKITLDKNGGKGGIDEVWLSGDQLFSDENKTNIIKQITVPTRTDYDFKGYKINEEDNKYIFDSMGNLMDDVDISSDQKLVAVWEEKIEDDEVQKITFVKKGGTGGTDKIYLKGGLLYSDKKCSKEITDITPPKKDKRNFLGYKCDLSDNNYYFDSNGKKTDYFDKEIQTGDINNMILYAVWGASEDVRYTITLNKNGGIDGTDNIYLKGNKLYLDEACTQEITKIKKPEKDGYEFKGYKFELHETTFDIEDNGKFGKDFLKNVRSGIYSSDLTLNAIWNKKTIINEQQYIDISGYVWKDIQSTKQTVRNDFYKDDETDNEDKLIEGVKVRLKNKNGKTVKTTYDENKLYETTTDKDGKYTFKNVKVNMLKEYYVEFEYNGIIYQCVNKHTGKENGSKVEEKEVVNNENGQINMNDARGTFNAKYAIVEKSEKNNNVSNSESYVDIKPSEDGETTRTLKYETNNYKADIQWKDEEHNDDEINQETIKSITELGTGTSYLQKTYEKLKENAKEAITTIDNINCGLYERAQPDIVLNKAVENIQLEINGQPYTYTGCEQGTVEKNVDKKFTEDHINRTYSRPIYVSDYMWENEEDRTKELKAYVTYKITLTSSGSLNARVNSFVDYYDKNYNVTEINNKLEGVEAYTEESGTNREILTIAKETLPEGSNGDYGGGIVVNCNIQIEAGKSKDVYIRFQLDRKGIMEIVESNEQNDNKYKLKNLAEIKSYSIYKDGWEAKNIYAGIDKNSAPGNTVPGIVKTYENDTEGATQILLKRNTKRSISGTVFLDNTGDDLKTGCIREGDGIFKNDEKTISGVVVELCTTDNKNVKFYDEDNKVWKDARIVTEKNGEFTIDGFIPGEYTVKYTWGNGTTEANIVINTKDSSDSLITVQNYKSTIYNYDRGNYDNQGNTVNNGWYDGQGENGSSIRYSDAIDDWNNRKEIDEKLKEIHQIEQEDKKVYNTNSSTDGIISSNTPVMKLGIERLSSDNYAIKNVDFGIARRARQSIKLVKRVDSVKITLANGQIIANIEIGEDGKAEKNNFMYISPSENEKGNGKNGQIKTEIDNELIQGAKAEITYKFQFENNSEVDILDEIYYKYGLKGYSAINGAYTVKNGDYSYEFKDSKNKKYYTKKENVVQIKPDIIVDYLDNNWPIDENSDWKEINKGKTTINETVFCNNDESSIKNMKVIYTEALKEKYVLPNEKSEMVKFKTSSLLTTTSNIELNNEAEIIKLSKNGGSTIESITPGNYVPGKSNYESDDSQAEKVCIIPNTGKNLDFVTPISISILMLSILTTGIILIKKKVLDSKN